VQVFGFIRLGLIPKRRNGAESGPRSGIGKCRFCQHPKQIAAGWGVMGGLNSLGKPLGH